MRVDSPSQGYLGAGFDVAHIGDSGPGEGLPSLDALSRLLLSLETQDQIQLQAQSERIAAAREHLGELQRELRDDLAEALRQAERAQRKQKKKGGWFSKTFGGTVDFFAKVVGKSAELTKDLLVLNADLAVSLYHHYDDPTALRDSISRDLLELTKSSETEQAVTGFVSGTAKFGGDFLVFHVALVDALARGAVRGDSAADLVVAESRRLYGSLETNILNNPDFWTVVERTAQVAAVAGAISSGGALGLVATAVILAIEADERYGYVEDLAGRKKAPWVRLGMHLGVIAAAAFAGDASQAVRYVQGATALLQGAHQAHQGVEILRESRQKSRELDANADVQETQNRMDQIRRLITRLIETYEQQSEDQTTNRELSANLAQAHAASHAAVVFPG